MRIPIRRMYRSLYMQLASSWTTFPRSVMRRIVEHSSFHDSVSIAGDNISIIYTRHSIETAKRVQTSGPGSLRFGRCRVSALGVLDAFVFCFVMRIICPRCMCMFTGSMAWSWCMQPSGCDHECSRPRVSWYFNG